MIDETVLVCDVYNLVLPKRFFVIELNLSNQHASLKICIRVEKYPHRFYVR